MKGSFNLIVLLILIFPIDSYSQQKPEYSTKTNFSPPPKVYLHIDRDYYFTSDSIWYKAYYLDRVTDQLLPGLITLYVDLVDSEGKMICNQVVLINNGVSSGKIVIPGASLPGNYLLRAYTDSQIEFGSDAFYHRPITISSLRDPIGARENENGTAKSDISGLIDVEFLPEGGSLLIGRDNKLGVKAIDDSGHAVSIHGRVVDSDGTVITNFSTEYSGMGILTFSPRQGKRYSVEIDENPEFKYEFTDMISEGIKIEILNEESDTLWIQASTNSVKLLEKDYYFVIMNRGETISYSKYPQRQKEIKIKISKSVLRPGINRFLLLDNQMNPISERLYFSDSLNFNDITIIKNQNQFKTRSEVKLEISDNEANLRFNNSSLSISVVSENAVKEDGPELNILSWLLIDSELNGNIESPGNYFVNDENISSQMKLDLLMMTHGWSRYFWNNKFSKEIRTNNYEPDGILINGRVEALVGKKATRGGEVDMTIFRDGYFFNSKTITDDYGRFSFDSIFFSDTASIFLTARNGKNSLSTEIFLDPIFREGPALSDIYLPKGSRRAVVPVDFYQQRFYSEQAMKDFIIDSGLFVLDEVLIEGTRVVKEYEPRRIYGTPNVSLKIGDRDIIYQNVIQYLAGRVAGVVVAGNDVIIRGVGTFMGGTDPLFLLDGVAVPQDYIMDLPMSNIDKVEVLKSPSETAIFGVRGGNGVISVFTKTGANFEVYDKFLMGTLAKKISGYSGYKEFYSPKYSVENINTERPDHRTTLYWNPNLITQEGKVSVSFYSSDDISKYRVFIEGVSENGTICFGTSEFVVNEHLNVVGSKADIIDPQF